LNEKIKKGILATERVINPRSTLPILNSILIRASKEGITLEATDLEMGVRYKTTGGIDKEGALAVPAKVLSGLIANIGGEKVTFKGDEGILTVEADSTKARINGASADEFPHIPDVKGKEVIKCPSASFKEQIAKVLFASAISETRPVLNGVLFASSAQEMKLVATDSFRLAEERSNIKPLGDFEVIVPMRTLSELLKISEEGEEVRVTLGENQILFSVGDVALVSRLIEGEYPDYEQIVPQEKKTQARLDVAEFSQLIKTAIVFARDNANNIKLILNQQGVEVSSASSELGEFKSLLKAKVEGTDNEINFNGKYLLDGLAVLEGKEANLIVNEKMAPALLTSVDNKDFRYVVMPLRS